MGGPIIKNKLFLFLDGERTKQDLLNPVLPSGPFAALTGSYQSPFREVDALAKLDWQISNKYHVFSKFTYNQNSSVLAIIPNSFQPFGNVNNTPSYDFGLDFNTGPYTHSFRFGYMKFRNGIVDAVTGSNIYNPEPQLELAIGADPDCLTAGADFFCSGPSYLAPQQTYQSDHQIKYDGSRVLGKHILRYGGGLNHISGGGFASFLKVAPAVGAQITDCNAACLAMTGGAANPANYPAQSVALGNGQGYDSEIPAFGFPAGGSGPDNRISAYFGDSWKYRPNLTITLGLRYVRDTGRSDSDLAPIADLNQFNNQYYSGLGNRVNQPNHNFAPQLGVAWDPSGNGKTVFRGGIGLFYENSLWNNIEFDRPARLPTGLFLANPTVCNNGLPNTSFTLPNGTAPDLSFCGQPISVAAPAINALQAAYQQATAAAGSSAPNPSYIGTALADGPHATGTALLAPNYVSPRSVQMNLGMQREIRRGTILTVDYVRNIETHTLLALDTNHVGDARFFYPANAQAAILATVTNNDGAAKAGCPSLGPPGTAMVTCYLQHFNGFYTGGGADPYAGTMSDFAANGLDSGYSLCAGSPCPAAAFAGINQNLGANQMLAPIGYAKNNALQISIKQHLDHPFRGVRNFDLQASHQMQSYIAAAADNDFINVATDFNNSQRYLGPNGLDRKHQISFGSTMDLPQHLHLGIIGHFYSPLPVALALSPSGNPGGIFVTDVTGDGTGDGSYAVNGSAGDVLPGTNIGSFGHGVTPGNINHYINTYNHYSALQPTPAGLTLINSGLFTLAQLQTPGFGGVQQLIPTAPVNEAGMGWLRTLDVNLSWVYRFREKVTIQPGVAFFNVMNIGNFDGPGNPLSGALSGTVGSVNGTSGQQPASNRLGLGSGVFALGSPRALEFSLKFSF